MIQITIVSVLIGSIGLLVLLKYFFSISFKKIFNQAYLYKLIFEGHLKDQYFADWTCWTLALFQQGRQLQICLNSNFRRTVAQLGNGGYKNRRKNGNLTT